MLSKRSNLKVQEGQLHKEVVDLATLSDESELWEQPEVGRELTKAERDLRTVQFKLKTAKGKKK